MRPGLISSVGTDERPDLKSAVHFLISLGSTFWNNGIFGDPWEVDPSMEWPLGSDNQHLLLVENRSLERPGPTWVHYFIGTLHLDGFYYREYAPR